MTRRFSLTAKFVSLKHYVCTNWQYKLTASNLQQVFGCAEWMHLGRQLSQPISPGVLVNSSLQSITAAASVKMRLLWFINEIGDSAPVVGVTENGFSVVEICLKRIWPLLGWSLAGLMQWIQPANPGPGPRWCSWRTQPLLIFLCSAAKIHRLTLKTQNASKIHNAWSSLNST